MALYVGHYICPISIHALRVEGDTVRGLGPQRYAISIHALRVEGDTPFIRCFVQIVISIHALRVEGDHHNRKNTTKPNYFYPRPPGGGRPETGQQPNPHARAFLSTPSGWRATPGQRQHRAVSRAFLSTPSGWRATFSYGLTPVSFRISIHALRVEGDLKVESLADSLQISIHALRVEGDHLRPKTLCRIRNFYPRPPGGGRQAHLHGVSFRRMISIHALRVEGDPRHCIFLSVPLYFYPRPPGGGRQQKRTKFSSVFAQKGEEFASLRREKRKICRWRFKKDKFWVLIWCEGSGKSVCALASHCG